MCRGDAIQCRLGSASSLCFVSDLCFSQKRFRRALSFSFGRLLRSVCRQELYTGMLDSLFVQGSWEIVHHREWLAYPVLDPKKVTERVQTMMHRREVEKGEDEKLLIFPCRAGRLRTCQCTFWAHHGGLHFAVPFFQVEDRRLRCSTAGGADVPTKWE